MISYCFVIISLGKGVTLHLNKIELPLPKNALFHFWLKLGQGFWRRRCIIQVCQCIFAIISPCKRAWPFIWRNLKSLQTRILWLRWAKKYAYSLLLSCQVIKMPSYKNKSWSNCKIHGPLVMGSGVMVGLYRIVQWNSSIAFWQINVLDVIREQWAMCSQYLQVKLFCTCSA